MLAVAVILFLFSIVLIVQNITLLSFAIRLEKVEDKVNESDEKEMK